jgi:hypothetical protein
MIHAYDNTAMRSLDFRQYYSYAMSTARSKHHTIALTKKGDFFLKREKKGRCFFRRRLKNDMHEGSTLHKEIYYINTHTNCLQVSLTKLRIMFKDIKLAKTQSFSLP